MAIQAQFFSDNFGFGSHDFVSENACGFDDHSLALIPHHHHHHHQDQFFQNAQKNLTFVVDHNHISNSQFLHHQSMAVSSHFEKQRLDFEHFINLQNERLRLAMQEQRKQQTALLMKKYDLKSRVLLKQKEEEIVKAANRRMELESFLKRMEMENLTWQRAAKEGEAMVASLNGTIQRLREAAGPSENGAEDAGSCCQDVREIGEKRDEKLKMKCRCCNSRDSCVVILPCRHLCSCKDCEVFLDSCPVCRMPKKASVEAFL